MRKWVTKGPRKLASWGIVLDPLVPGVERYLMVRERVINLKCEPDATRSVIKTQLKTAGNTNGQDILKWKDMWTQGHLCLLISVAKVFIFLLFVLGAWMCLLWNALKREHPSTLNRSPESVSSDSWVYLSQIKTSAPSPLRLLALDSFCVVPIFCRGVGNGDLHIQKCREKGQNGWERVSRPAQEAVRDKR